MKCQVYNLRRRQYNIIMISVFHVNNNRNMAISIHSRVASSILMAFMNAIGHIQNAHTTQRWCCLWHSRQWHMFCYITTINHWIQREKEHTYRKISIAMLLQRTIKAFPSCTLFAIGCRRLPEMTGILGVLHLRLIARAYLHAVQYLRHFRKFLGDTFLEF